MTDRPPLLRPDDHAGRAPDSTAVVVPATGQRISYRTEYFEVVWAARRAGYLYTAINWHLTPGEVRYMLENSDSKALIVSAGLADVAGQAAAGLPSLTPRLLVGGDAIPPGWDDYAATVAKAGTTPLGPELEGQAMLYSSSTTGRPGKMMKHRLIEQLKQASCT